MKGYDCCRVGNKKAGLHNSKSRLFRFGLLVFTLLLIAGLFSGCREEEPIRIGVIISQSGPGGYLSATLDAIQLAVNEVNENGGIQNRIIELYSTDNETDRDIAIRQFREMEKEVSPDLYITALSAISSQLIPLAEKAEVPILCIVTSMEALTENAEWAFRFYAMASEEVSPIMTSLVKNTIKSLGILHSDDEYGMSVFNQLSIEALKEGISVSDESFTNGDADLTEQVRKLSGNEGIYVVGLASAIPVAISAFSETGYMGYRLAPSGACNPDILSMPDAEGMLIAAPILYKPNFFLAERLTSTFMERYGITPNHQAASGYEAIKILAGLLQDGEITRSAIREKMSSGFVYTGTLGNISVPKGEHDYTFPLYPARIEKGGIVYE